MDTRSGYDFNNDLGRLKGQERLRTERPLLLIGSSRCVNFSQHQNPHKSMEALAREEIQHLTLACDLHREQLDNGRCFLHEDSRKELESLDDSYNTCW